MPSYQGEYDGLCGPYAIINAFAQLGYTHPQDAVLFFKTACSAIPKKRWPNVLWDGTNIIDMRRMINACSKLDGLDFKVSYPFLGKGKPKNNSEYWKRFDDFLKHGHVNCAILGRIKPSLHWIVVYQIPGRKSLVFIDTDPHKATVVKRPKSLYAGKNQRRNFPKAWQFDYEEFIVFSK